MKIHRCELLNDGKRLKNGDLTESEGKRQKTKRLNDKKERHSENEGKTDRLNDKKERHGEKQPQGEHTDECRTITKQVKKRRSVPSNKQVPTHQTVPSSRQVLARLNALSYKTSTNKKLKILKAIKLDSLKETRLVKRLLQKLSILIDDDSAEVRRKIARVMRKVTRKIMKSRNKKNGMSEGKNDGKNGGENESETDNNTDITDKNDPFDIHPRCLLPLFKKNNNTTAGYFIYALEQADPEIRTSSLKSLRHLSHTYELTEHVIPFLLDGLFDVDEGVVEVAGRCLWRIGGMYEIVMARERLEEMICSGYDSTTGGVSRTSGKTSGQTSGDVSRTSGGVSRTSGQTSGGVSRTSDGVKESDERARTWNNKTGGNENVPYEHSNRNVSPDRDTRRVSASNGPRLSKGQKYLIKAISNLIFNDDSFTLLVEYLGELENEQLVYSARKIVRNNREMIERGIGRGILGIEGAGSVKEEKSLGINLEKETFLGNQSVLSNDASEGVGNGAGSVGGSNDGAVGGSVDGSVSRPPDQFVDDSIAGSTDGPADDSIATPIARPADDSVVMPAVTTPDNNAAIHVDSISDRHSFVISLLAHFLGNKSEFMEYFTLIAQANSKVTRRERRVVMARLLDYLGAGKWERDRYFHCCRDYIREGGGRYTSGGQYGCYTSGSGRAACYTSGGQYGCHTGNPRYECSVPLTEGSWFFQFIYDVYKARRHGNFLPLLLVYNLASLGIFTFSGLLSFLSERRNGKRALSDFRNGKHIKMICGSFGVPSAVFVNDVFVLSFDFIYPGYDSRGKNGNGIDKDEVKAGALFVCVRYKEATSYFPCKNKMTVRLDFRGIGRIKVGLVMRMNEKYYKIGKSRRIKVNVNE